MDYTVHVFERQKVAQVILYILKELNSAVPIPSLYTILYQADRTHAERFGRSVTEDRWIKIVGGHMLPLNTNQLLLEVDIKGNTSYGFYLSGEGYLVALTQPDLQRLSQSDLYCLNIVITEFIEDED